MKKDWFLPFYKAWILFHGLCLVLLFSFVVYADLTSHTEATLDTLLLNLDSDADGAMSDETWFSNFILEAEVDDTPVNGVTTEPVSSNWAYDHENLADPHTQYILTSEIGTDVPSLTGEAGYTGSHDFDGADDLEIPNGAASTVDTDGQIAHDTTADQLIVGADPVVFHPELFTSGPIENLANGDDNYEFMIAPFPLTVTEVGVHCRGTCTTTAQISFEDRSGNAMTHTTVTASTGTSNTTFVSVTAGGSLVKGEGLAFDVDNTPNPETDEYTISVIFTADRQ